MSNPEQKETLLVAIAYKDKELINSIQVVGNEKDFKLIDTVLTKLKGMNASTNRVDLHALKRVNFEKLQSFRV